MTRPLILTPSSCFFFQAKDGIRILYVTGVQTCALPIELVQLPLQPRCQIAADIPLPSPRAAPPPATVVAIRLMALARGVLEDDRLPEIRGAAPLAERGGFDVEGQYGDRAEAIRHAHD